MSTPRRRSRELHFTQAVRVLDVIAIGPVMVAGAVWARPLPMPLRLFLGVSGIATVLYNGLNFLRNVKGLR